LELRQLSRRAGTLSDDLLGEIGRLRVEAWSADGELPSAATSSTSWTDEHDDHAEHFVIFEDGRICAASRICIHNNGETLPDAEIVNAYTSKMKFPVACFNRLVVAPLSRGRKLSLQLDHARATFAAEAHVHSILGGTHLPRRLNDLERLGFVNLGVSPYRDVSYSPTFVFLKSLMPRAAITADRGRHYGPSAA
jgi:hypothetical protein